MKLDPNTLFLKRKKTPIQKLVFIYGILSGIPIIIYIVLMIAAAIRPPMVCRQNLAHSDQNKPYESICDNWLARPVAYFYPLLFVDVDGIVGD